MSSITGTDRRDGSDLSRQNEDKLVVARGNIILSLLLRIVSFFMANIPHKHTLQDRQAGKLEIITEDDMEQGNHTFIQMKDGGDKTNVPVDACLGRTN